MLGLRRLQDPAAGTSAPAALKFDPPARRAQARNIRRRLAGRAGDAPAAERRRARHRPRLANRTAIGPPVQQHAQTAALLAGQLQPSSGLQLRSLSLADGGGDADGAQRVLQHRQHLGLVAGPDLDQPAGGNTQPRQARREQVGAPHHPDHRPGLQQGPDQQGGEGGGGGAGLILQPRAHHLVPGPRRQAAGRETAVDPGIAKGQDRSRSPSPCFQSSDPALQSRETRLARSGHPSNPFVPLLF